MRLTDNDRKMDSEEAARLLAAIPRVGPARVERPICITCYRDGGCLEHSGKGEHENG